MILRRIVRKAALVVAVVVPGALGLACPAKDLDIVISTRGVAFLGVACSQAQNCLGKQQLACAKNQACFWSGSVCVGKCRIPGNHTLTADGLHDLQVLLFSSNPARFRKPSACVALARCEAGDVDGCQEKSLNDGITRALGAGSDLTFDGFEDTSDGFAALAIFERPAGSDASEPPSCAPELLTACAGLDVPLNETKLDIECASCQDGQRSAFGESTRPCPANLLSARDCFLRTCYTALGGDLTE